MKAVTVTFLLLLYGCAATPPVPVPAFAGQAGNTCLPESIVVVESLRRQGVPARVVIISTRGYTHAIVAYLYPIESPLLWVWDAEYQSQRILADFNNPVSIALAWFRENALEDIVISAEFM